MILRSSTAALIALLAAASFASAQEFRYDATKFEASLLAKRTDPAMQRWRENRLGMFVHWGLYSVLGGEWKGKAYPGAAEFIRGSAGIPKDEYEALVSQFNPTSYNPVKWAAMAKDMGVKYATLTTKHHEGFCMWPSKYSDYSIAATPYGKDIVGPFVKAYNDAGIDVFLYYSILDWHHPDYLSKIGNEADQQKFDRYLAYMQDQLDELIRTYPTIKGIWFDGQWEQSCKTPASLKAGLELEKHLREIKPGIILNNRLRSNLAGSLDRDSEGRPYGDYDSSYERRLPVRKSDTDAIPFDWESCMTVPENTWGYNKHWEGHIKSSSEIIEMMATCSSLGGNFLLNFGPTEKGEIVPYEVNLAKEIGAWMKENGHAIYGSENSGLAKQDWGYITRRPSDDSYHLIVFNVPLSGHLLLRLKEGLTLDSANWHDSAGVALEVEKGYGHDYLIQLPKTPLPRQPFVIPVKLKH